MSRATRPGLVGLVLLLSSCGLGRDRGITNEHDDRLERDQSFEIDGTERNYHLYLPENPSNAPIVFLLHGNGGSADQILGIERTKAPFEVWLDVAFRENLVLVVPDGLVGPDFGQGWNNKQGWNDCRTDAPTNPDADDVTFLGALLDEVQDTYGLEDQQVFVTGVSNGGLMSQRLADAIPERLDAIAVVVASRPVNNECDSPTTPVPVLFMNGTDDPILPYDGGQIDGGRGLLLPTLDTVAYWVERNRADPTPIETVLADTDGGEGSTIVRRTYAGGADGADVEHYEVIGGGHTEPSIQERYSRIYKRIVGEQNGDIEMAEEIWSFFERQ